MNTEGNKYVSDVEEDIFLYSGVSSFEKFQLRTVLNELSEEMPKMIEKELTDLKVNKRKKLSESKLQCEKHYHAAMHNIQESVKKAVGPFYAIPETLNGVLITDLIAAFYDYPDYVSRLVEISFKNQEHWMDSHLSSLPLLPHEKIKLRKDVKALMQYTRQQFDEQKGNDKFQTVSVLNANMNRATVGFTRVNISFSIENVAILVHFIHMNSCL